jgi:hypothetical protein
MLQVTPLSSKMQMQLSMMRERSSAKTNGGLVSSYKHMRQI